VEEGKIHENGKLAGGDLVKSWMEDEEKLKVKKSKDWVKVNHHSKKKTKGGKDQQNGVSDRGPPSSNTGVGQVRSAKKGVPEVLHRQVNERGKKDDYLGKKEERADTRTQKKGKKGNSELKKSLSGQKMRVPRSRKVRKERLLEITSQS